MLKSILYFSATQATNGVYFKGVMYHYNLEQSPLVFSPGPNPLQCMKDYREFTITN